jgi:hypothetical protein
MTLVAAPVMADRYVSDRFCLTSDDLTTRWLADAHPQETARRLAS